MTLRELHYIVALADKGNFGRAAESCHVGQPTLSMQLKKLEDYLEVTLFERDNHHVSPTPIGEEVIEQARIALEAVEEIRELARQAHDPMDGVLRVGVIPTLGPYLVPALLPMLKRSFPKLRLLSREERDEDLLDGLRRYRFDAILQTLPMPDSEFDCMALFDEALLLALPAGHPLQGKPQVEVDDLAQLDLLVLETGHSLREQLVGLLGGRRPLHREEFEASSLEALRQMVAAGIGGTLVPALAAVPAAGSPHDGMVQFRPFASAPFRRTIGIAWRRSYARAATVLSLARFIQANLPAGVEAASPIRELAAAAVADRRHGQTHPA